MADKVKKIIPAFFLGANIPSPRVLGSKVEQIIEALNTLFTGTLAFAVTITDTTQSTSSTTGALIVSGGVGIAKNVNIGGFLIESSSSITAGIVQTQAGATPVTSQTSKVTVGTAGDGIRLPAATAGLEITVYNSDPAKYMQVYGTGTDTINGAVSTVGVKQAPSSIDIYVCPIAGIWVAEIGAGFSGSLLTELSQDNLVATGIIQGTAALSFGQTIRITSGGGGGVLLPPSAPGLEILMINHSGGNVQVYGTGADQVDDLVNTLGVSQMNNSMVIFSCATTGNWYSNGIGTGFSGSFPTVSVTDTISAAGVIQGTATPLITVLNRVTVVAAGSGVKLPIAAPGLVITVSNAQGVNALLVYPFLADTIAPGAVNVGFSIPANKGATFSVVGTSPATWHAVLGA